MGPHRTLPASKLSRVQTDEFGTILDSTPESITNQPAQDRMFRHGTNTVWELKQEPFPWALVVLGAIALLIGLFYVIEGVRGMSTENDYLAQEVGR